MTKLPYTQNIDDCFADRIGGKGLAESAFDAMLARCAPSIEKLRARQQGQFAAAAAPAGPHRRSGADAGSRRPISASASPMSWCWAPAAPASAARPCARWPIAASARRRARPSCGSWTMSIPTRSANCSSASIPNSTGFIAISKSGGTAETLTQLLIGAGLVRGALRRRDRARSCGGDHRAQKQRAAPPRREALASRRWNTIPASAAASRCCRWSD